MNVAVTGLPLVAIADSSTRSPVIVLKVLLTAEEEAVVVAEDAEDAVVGGTVRTIALARALDNPAGEHPTKSGAVSLTAAHSCLLN